MALKERSTSWHFGLSAYWFATNLKWFVLLTAVISSQVSDLVPGGSEGTYWGRVVMIGAIWALFGPALFGAISDRLGRWRPFLALGAALTVAALFLLSNANSFSQILIGYLFLQVSDDVAQGPYSSLIPGLVPETQRGKASGIMSLLMMFAQIVGGVGAFLLSPNIKAIYIMIALTIAVCACITLLTVRDAPEKQAVERQGYFQGWLAPMQDPDFRWVWFTRFLNALGFYLVYNYLRFFLRDRVGDFHFFSINLATVDPKKPDAAAFQAVFILALWISLIAAISAYYGGTLADKIGRKKVIYISGALMTLPLIPFTLVPNFTLIMLMAIPFAIGYGAYQSADWALASDVMPDKNAVAKDMGLWQSSIAAPQIFSGAAGAALDWGNGKQAGLGYTMIFLFASIAFALGIILVKQVRRST